MLNAGHRHLRQQTKLSQHGCGKRTDTRVACYIMECQEGHTICNATSKIRQDVSHQHTTQDGNFNQGTNTPERYSDRLMTAATDGKAVYKHGHVK